MADDIPKPEKVGTNPLFVLFYLIVLAACFLYPGYILGFEFESYSWRNLLSLSGYIIPAFCFSVFGIMTVRSKKSIIFAVCAAAISLVILVFAYQIGDFTIF